MKKITALILAFVFTVCLLTACNDSVQNKETKLPETADECIGTYKEAHTDEGDVSLDINIPKLNFETEAAKSINAEIAARFYSTDVKTAIDGGFTNIGIYITPKASLYDKVLSLRIDETYTPSYGTDGNVYLVCYDVENGVQMSMAYVLSHFGYDYETVMNEARAAAQAEYGATEYFEPQGVYVNEDGSLSVVSYVIAEHGKAEAWKSISEYKVPTPE